MKSSFTALINYWTGELLDKTPYIFKTLWWILIYNKNKPQNTKKPVNFLHSKCE